MYYDLDKEVNRPDWIVPVVPTLSISSMDDAYVVIVKRATLIRMLRDLSPVTLTQLMLIGKVVSK